MCALQAQSSSVARRHHARLQRTARTPTGITRLRLRTPPGQTRRVDARALHGRGSTSASRHTSLLARAAALIAGSTCLRMSIAYAGATTIASRRVLTLRVAHMGGQCETVRPSARAWWHRRHRSVAGADVHGAQRRHGHGQAALPARG